MAAPKAPPAASRAPTDPPAAAIANDPLPDGALARLGTGWLRGQRCLFLPDGRRLVRERADRGLQIFEVPSGKPLVRIRGTDVPERKEIVGSTIAFTRDGKYLAAVCWQGRCGVWETATGRLVRWLESGKFYSIVRCDFSPDGKLLAVGGATDTSNFNSMNVGVYEVESGRRLFGVLGTNSAFAPDGRSLVTWNGYGHGAVKTARRVAVPSGEELSTFSYEERFPDFAPRSDGVWFFEITADNSVVVREAASGRVKHTFRGPEGGESNAVYIRHVPGRRELIAVGTRPAGLWCWDLETAKELWQARLAAPAYFPGLSADGSTLVTADNGGTVRAWEVATGKERSSFRPGPIGHGDFGAIDSGTPAVVSPDGKIVATFSGGIFSTSVALWDAASGERLSDLPGHASGVTAAAFAPDGTRVYTVGKDRTLRVWDPATGRELLRAPAEPALSLAVSADGANLFAAAADGTVRILNAQTGKVERRLPAFGKVLVGAALTADGQRLVTAGPAGDGGGADLIRVSNAGTGAKLCEFGGSEGQVEQLAVSADGGVIATTHVGQRVAVWDAGGKKFSEQVGRGQRKASWAKGETPYRIGSVGLSPDGRWLAYSDQEQGVAIVDTRTGRETGRAKLDVFYQNGAARTELRDVLAFAPDGKTVAWSGVESTADVFLIEVRTGQVRRRLPGDSYPVQQLKFSPDGVRLLSAGPDGSALIWDVRGRPAPQAVAPPANEVAGWWDRLADPDAVKAYQAMRALAAHPAAAVALLREKLPPVRAVGAAKLDALVAKLDDPDFKAREDAERELAALADAAEPRLRAALRGASSLEVRRRAERVLERIEAGWLRSERAVEVLEMIGDAAAGRLLRELAGGLPGAARTTDAAGAVARAAATSSGAAR
jgi:WD40 repeat protein